MRDHKIVSRDRKTGPREIPIIMVFIFGAIMTKIGQLPSSVLRKTIEL